MAGRVAAVGEEPRVAGFALAGALVVATRTPEDVVAAWAALPADVVLVVLTPSAAAALGDEPARSSSTRLAAVMPA